MDKQQKKILGRAEQLSFPELQLEGIAARIDTGAKTSSIWVSDAHIDASGTLQVVFFGPENEHYVDKPVAFDEFESVAVASSTGQVQHRYKVRLLVKIKGKKVRAAFTLADRASQVYPVLIGRNVLLGKFIVDVKRGKTLTEKEKRRSQALQSGLADVETGEK